MKKNFVIFGATSAIAQAVAWQLLKAGHDVFLVGRNEMRLAAMAADFTIRLQRQIRYKVYELTDINSHAILVQDLIAQLGIVDGILIAYGVLPEQKKAEQDFNYALASLQTNLLSPLSLLTHWANYFSERKTGILAVISSVAGDRGRQSNYIYGTAKAGLNTFLQGLRNRLHDCHVSVLTIKPGFIITPMTQNFKKGPLWVTADKIAAPIAQAILQQKSSTIYTPRFWYLIMLLIRNIPERIFCKLKL